MRTAAWTDSVSVLDRLSAVLDAFGDDGEGLTVTQLARRANLPKSTVSRIATELVDEGYLDRDGALLFLGVRLFEFGQSVDRPRRIRDVSRPAMKRLRDATGHSVHVAVIDDDSVIIVADAHGRSGPARSAVGDRHPRDETALGIACAAAHGASGESLPAHERTHGDVSCVACAIVVRGHAIAAVSVSGPVERVEVDDAAPLVRATALAIARELASG